MTKKKWNLYILKTISETHSIINVPLPKSTLSRYTTRLKNEGLITYVSYGTWEITDKGSTFIKGYEAEVELVKEFFHIHSYQIGIPILENVDRIPSGWELRKRKEKFNWESWGYQLNTKIGIVDIEKFPNQFVITLPRLFVRDDSIATRIKNQLILQIIGLIKEWFQEIKLEAYDKNTGDFFILSHLINKHVGLPNDPLAQLCLNLGIKELRSKRLMIDNSPKNLKRLKHIYEKEIHGELEGIDKTLSSEDITRTIWPLYHDMVDGTFTTERMNKIEENLFQTTKNLKKTSEETQTAISLMNQYGEHFKTHVAVLKEIKTFLKSQRKEGMRFLSQPSKAVSCLQLSLLQYCGG